MTAVSQTLDDDNIHVQELKRLFLASNVDENQCLNAEGLFTLCDQLNLSAYAKEIIERVLLGAGVVDFHNFKDRFVSYLPEIIDVSTGAVDPLLTQAQEAARSLGFGEGKRLSRYETRLLCENTAELVQLSVVDINNLFERADLERTGHVSLQQFLAQYRYQKRLSAEVHFISDSFISSLNLFEAIDSCSSGTIDSQDLLECWSKAGLRLDEGVAVLKEAGQPTAGTVNSVCLSGFLEKQLSRAISEAPVSVKAAVITLHSCIDNLRCMLREGESRAEHLYKQLQLGNQRRALLIEELEHNQISIEQGYERRLRETEERYRTRCLQMEDKFRLDKREIQHQVEQLEEELSRLRQVEISTKNKVLLLERQNYRLLEENREQVDALTQVQHLNRQLRMELNKVTHSRPTDENSQLIMHKQKLEIVVAHNKRLRERIRSLNARQKKTCDKEPLTWKWSSAFRSQVMLLNKRRLAKGDTLSEMESEPESIFVRHRRRRLLKRKERKLRHECVASRLLVQNSDEADSLKTLQKDNSSRHFGSEQSSAQDEHKKELLPAGHRSTTKALTDAIVEQQKHISLQLVRERRNWEARLLSEKDRLEKSFAEEKLKLVRRLQILESSLDSQAKIYEMRMARLREQANYPSPAKNDSFVPLKSTSNFFAFLRRDRSPNPSLPTFPESLLSLLPHPGVKTSTRSADPPLCLKSSYVTGRCEKCDLTAVSLRELYYSVTGDCTITESGIEDLGSSAGSMVDEKTVLRRELRKLKGRLEATKEKLGELRILFNIPSSGVKPRIGGSEDDSMGLQRPSFRGGEAASLHEKLENKNVILEARLLESQHLIKTLVEQYNTQLDETARVGAILRDVYLQSNVLPDISKTELLAHWVK